MKIFKTTIRPYTNQKYSVLVLGAWWCTSASALFILSTKLLLLPGSEIPSWKFWPSQRPLSTSLDPGRRLSNFLSSFARCPVWYYPPIYTWVFLVLWAQIFFLKFSSQRLIVSEIRFLSTPMFLRHRSLLVLLQFRIILISTAWWPICF